MLRMLEFGLGNARYSCTAVKNGSLVQSISYRLAIEIMLRNYIAFLQLHKESVIS